MGVGVEAGMPPAPRGEVICLFCEHIALVEFVTFRFQEFVFRLKACCLEASIGR